MDRLATNQTNRTTAIPRYIDAATGWADVDRILACILLGCHHPTEPPAEGLYTMPPPLDLKFWPIDHGPKFSKN